MKPTTTVKKIVYGGWGLAHHDGRTLFLPCTAPGDTVEFTLVKEKKKVLFGHVDSIVEPSPRRIAPECPVFGECGGCHSLHLGYEDEIATKETVLLENLERIGKVKTALAGVTASPERFGYRNHAVLRVNDEGRPGFTARESESVVPFPEQGCLLLPRVIRDEIAALPPESLPRGGEVRVRLDRFGAVHFWGLTDRVGPPDVLMEAKGFLFPVAPESFFQVNRHLNARLIDLVVSLPREVRRRLLDLYCGVGFFTLPLSRLVMEATGIESDAPAYRSAIAARRLNKTTNIRFMHGVVERMIHKLRDFDIIVADPPRSGIAAQALKGIIRIRPTELIVVSCEPPTLARDTARLIEAGYFLRAVHLVDLFPGTYHIETVALFRRS
jgi:23S rRNA (uracil1939-C5)-methyltransferase